MEAGCVLLRLGFGREIARDHVLLDGVVAFEAQDLIGDAAQSRDAAQGAELACLLQAGREAAISTSMDAPWNNWRWPLLGGAIVVENDLRRHGGRLRQPTQAGDRKKWQEANLQRQ